MEREGAHKDQTRLAGVSEAEQQERMKFFGVDSERLLKFGHRELPYVHRKEPPLVSYQEEELPAPEGEYLRGI